MGKKYYVFDAFFNIISTANWSSSHMFTNSVITNLRIFFLLNQKTLPEQINFHQKISTFICDFSDNIQFYIFDSIENQWKTIIQTSD